MNISEFLRLYPMRAPQIMWFLGAGASAAAGIPTAYHMIWEFKRAIYCSTQRVPLSACNDLANSLVRSRIQQHFNSLANVPPEDHAEEYSFYFDQAYSSEVDRRKYIDHLVSSAAPSYGHVALAALLRIDKARAIWTTNFDRMVEDAAARIFGSSSRLIVSSIDAPNLAAEAFSEGRWPMLVKLHGDFHSRRLKNTSEELRAQDAELRQSLVTACRTQGLAIVGYSGRDDSVMEAIEEACAAGRGYPSGLFWFHRTQTPCLPRVAELIRTARDSGIDAHLIEVETFDELMADVVALMPGVPADVAEMLDARPRRVSNAPLPSHVGSWPVLRLNAFPIVFAPSVCRRVVCEIRGHKEVR
jgi:NAD-dependent SIR2 family protein deacetylase